MSALHFPRCFLKDACTPKPALISSRHRLSTSLPRAANATTCSSQPRGTHTTPSWSATMQSPGLTVTAGNSEPPSPAPPTGEMMIGTFTSDGLVKGDWPSVEWPLAKTGKPAARCSAISLQRPEMMTPWTERACAPAVIRPPQTALLASVEICSAEHVVNQYSPNRRRLRRTPNVEVRQ